MAAPMSLHDFGFSEPAYCRLNQQSFTFKNDLMSLVNRISKFLPCQSQHLKILSEFKILNIVLYRRGAQFRKAKFLQLLKRVQACLKRFRKFEKLFQLLLALNNDLKSAAASEKSGKKSCYLPTQQSWIFILYLKAQYFHLLDVTASYCVSAFNHLSQMFTFGWFISTILVLMGIVARVWLLCNTLMEKVITGYNDIYPHRSLFQETLSDWVAPSLPASLCLTTRSETDNLLEHNKKRWEEWSNFMFVEVAAESNTSSEGPWAVLSTLSSDGKKFPETKSEVEKILQDEDLGEPVTLKRKANDVIKPKKKLKKVKDNHSEQQPSQATLAAADTINVFNSKSESQKVEAKKKKQKSILEHSLDLSEITEAKTPPKKKIKKTSHIDVIDHGLDKIAKKMVKNILDSPINVTESMKLHNPPKKKSLLYDVVNLDETNCWMVDTRPQPVRFSPTELMGEVKASIPVKDKPVNSQKTLSTQNFRKKSKKLKKKKKLKQK